MTWLISLVTGLGVPSRFAKSVLAVVGAILLIAALWGLKALYDHRVIANHEQKLEQRAKPATDKAAEERANDAIANAKNEQEMHDAIQAQPDQPIAPTSHALACERLRRAGRSVAACR